MNTHIPASELAPEDAWVTSSYSGDTGNNCIQIADLVAERDEVAVRDSKDKSGPALTVSPAAWSAFVGLAQSGRADFGMVDI
ncbi:DUF397 domain-containing protein [Streptomyces sp. H27-D2]|uniref:DUF397 domain-containing protein n=1 Tax=Streptomyces sp. H27-D2 TaxID=3046304 RepID=UPI002DBE31BA|nr:DUF397 domain-containing protein [Streptomyces sp. H27-D2]MEC4019206.1 DUF397 domain-containing protein [Streptomyces sp. H27-D2]